MPAPKSSKAPKMCEVCKKPAKKACVCAKANGGKGPQSNAGQATKGAFDMSKIMQGKK